MGTGDAPLKKLAYTAVALVLLIAGGALALALFDWNHARGWIGKQVEKRTGRELVIAGDLKVQPFSLYPRVRAEHVTFANAGWGENRPMVDARSIEFTFGLWRMLFGGRLVVPELKLSGADVLLQRASDGRRNWILKEPDKTDEGRDPQILALAVEESQVRVKDVISETDVNVAVQSQPSDTVYGTDIAAKGRVRGVPLNLKGASGGLLRLMDDSTPYPIRVEGTLGDARASAKGTLTGVIGDVNVDATMVISGGNLAPLGDVLKISLPHTKPYKLSGTLERRGTKWTFRQFRGVVGRSDLGGDFNVDTAGERPVLTADLKSTLMDIKDLGGFVGVKPGEAEAAKAPGKLLPSQPYNLDKLRRIDAQVKLVATRFQNERAPLDNLDARLNLVNGVFKLEPIVFGVADGKVSSNVTLNAREPTIAAALDSRFSKLHLNRLIPGTQKIDEAFGAVDGRLKLAGRGNSPASMLASANGSTDLYSQGGEVSNLMMEFAGADIAEIVKFWVGGDRKVQLRCAVASFKVDNGVASTNTLIVDTDDTYIGGTGQVSFRDETFDLKLTPLPKDFSILALRGPLKVSGTFEKPDFGLEKGPLARKIGASVLLGLINPLAAILPLIETGPGKDAPCGQLVAQVHAAAGSKAGPPAPPRATAAQNRREAQPDAEKKQEIRRMVEQKKREAG
jgi:uncharacterized protein involved in outer membrane biogenesis